MNTYNKRFIYFICLVSAMGGLLFGYDWVVIGGAKPFYELYFNISDSPSQQGLAMTIALIGCMIGAMVCGRLADRVGRRRLLFGSSVVFLLSSVAIGLAQSFGFFLAARFVGGIGIGLASGLSPMYIAEVAPASVRGKMVSLNQMTIVLGILGAQITNWLIADPIPAAFSQADIAASWNGRMAWRWMFLAAAVPSVVFMVASLYIPESPRWLLMKGRRKEAEDILTHIGGSQYCRRETEAFGTGGRQSGGSMRMLAGKAYRGVLLLGVFIAVFQQWCGTNVIFNYAQEIFQSAGYAIGDVLFNIVITGVANVVFTVAAIFTVDRIGRRKLMLAGAGGLCAIYLTLGWCYYAGVTGMFMIVLVVAAIACYAMTLGPCTWVLISEIFPTKVRAVAVATCTFALWVGSSLLTYTFPLLNSCLGSYGTFWIYSAVCACGLAVFVRFLPETKGKSLEELEALFKGGAAKGSSQTRLYQNAGTGEK